MSILFLGGEDIDIESGSYAITTTSTYFRSGYARCAVNPTSGGFMYFSPFSGGAVTACWVSAQIYDSSALTNQPYFGLIKSGTGGLKGLWLGHSSSYATKLAVWKHDGTSLTLLADETGNSLSAALLKLDIHMQNYASTATVEVWINNTRVINYSGSIAISGVSGLDQIAMYASSASPWIASELIATDTEDTRTWSVVTHYPSGAGDSSAWTGGYAEVDEVTTNYVDIATSATAGQDLLMALSDVPSGTYNVRAARVAARACKGTSGITGLSLGVKSGSTTDVDTAHTLATGWATVGRLLETNPDTNAPFTTSELDSLQLALRSAT